MGPFWIEELRMKNFRSYPDARIKFSRSGMTLLRGHNLDTGGSSYSGKTSIPLAISLALGFCPFSAKDQRSWGADGAMYVELDIATEEGKATIRAGDKPWLKLPDGRKVTSATAIKSELARFLKVNPDVLAALTYQQQGEKSRFLAKTDSEKKEFLSNVMPWLVKIEQADETCDKNIVLINQKIAAATQFVEYGEKMLQAIVIQEPVLVQVPMIDETQAEIKRTSDKVKSELVIARDQMAKAEAIVVDTVLDDTAVGVRKEAAGRLAAVRKDETQRIQAHNVESARLSTNYGQLSAMISSIPSLKQEIHSMQINKCFTCDQPWDPKGSLVEAQAKLVMAQEAERLLPAVAKQRSQLVFSPDPKIAQLEEMVAGLDRQIAKLQADQNTLRNQKASAIQAAQVRMYSLQAQEQQLFVEAMNVRNQVAMVEKENEHRLADYARAVAEKEKQVAINSGHGLALKPLQAELKAEQDFQALIGRTGFLGSIFEEVLREISEETNLILASVANTAHVTLNFLSEVSTQKGKINKEIRPVIQISGHSADLKSGASGGMGTSIGLAVDLAVATVVSRRTNTWPGWLIQDESFEGLDQVSKETCMEILKKHACNRLILVVDHASETKELFTNFIDIEFQNGVSRVYENRSGRAEPAER